MPNPADGLTTGFVRFGTSSHIILKAMFGIPEAVTCLELAEVVGMTQAHTSATLTRLRQSGFVYLWKKASKYEDPSLSKSMSRFSLEPPTKSWRTGNYKPATTAERTKRYRQRMRRPPVTSVFNYGKHL